MAKYRTATILAEKSVSGTATEDIPILLRDIISRLRITWRTEPSKHGMDSYQHRDITKIELVDGSDVLFSMNGGQAQALNIYNRKCPSMNYGQHLSGSSQLAEFGIDFGRFLYDRELALDPKRFDSLMLRISHNAALSDTGVTAGNLAVLAEVFDERAVSPIGFLSAREHMSRTPPASGYFYSELPTDRVIRTLLLQGYLTAREPWYVVDELRLDEDGESKIPFDWNLETYYRMMRGSVPPVEEMFIAATVEGGRDYYVTPTDYWVQYSLQGRSDAVSVGLAGLQSGGKSTVICEAGGGNITGHVRGYLPNHCFSFPFGDPQDIDDWYDVTRLGSCRLRMSPSTAAATGTVAVVLQQLRRG